MIYTVYILECSDGSLYTGCSNNMQKRLLEHNSSKNGAKYTHGRRPVELVYMETGKTYADARAREAEIKKMKRCKKMELIHSKKKNC